MNQFSFFPHFPCSDIDLRLSRFHLFNFWRYKDVYIPDSPVKEKIEKLCSLYVDSDLEKLSSPTIVVLDDEYSFEPLTDEQLEDLQRFALSFLFCSITRNQKNTVCVSEQFTLVHQNFNLTEDSIVYTTGSFFRVQNWQSFETTRLIRPSYVPKETFFYRFDDKLLGGLVSAIEGHSSNDDYLFRALEWVRHAFMNADGYGGASRHVMLATAFEIFFNLPDYHQEDRFAERLESLLGVSSMVVYDEKRKPIQTGLKPITKPNWSGKNKSNTIYGWWARDFYYLRSKIVHGADITNNDIRTQKGEQHLLVGLQMLNFCYYRLLEDRGYLVFKIIEGLPEFEGLSYEKISKYQDLRKIEAAIS